MEAQGLKEALGIEAPDDFYEALIEAHDGLSSERSALLNARLILLLANEVGDQRVLTAAIDAAKADV